MKKNGLKILTLLLAFTVAFSMTACAGSTVKSDKVSNKINEKLSLKSKCVVVYDLTDKKVVYSKNPDKKTWPSSLAKIVVMTAALDKIKDLNTRYATAKSDYDYIDSVGETYTNYFKLGEKATIKDYLFAMMYGSKADACLAVTRYLGNGNTKKGIAVLNSEMKSLGMTHSHIDAPLGTDSDGTYITCSDYKKLLSHAMKYKVFRQMLVGKTYVVKANNKRTRDTTLKHSVFAHIGKGSLIMGGKVGYTDKAQKCMVSYSKINKKEYICITTEAKRSKSNEYPNFRDSEKIFKAIKDQTDQNK
jgi:D-alanyl-D-alanine carboxypeptidase (penicillin-binding protein 5/6)